MEKYSAAWFIEKFSMIDSKHWGMGSLQDKCALYHCGMREYKTPTEESMALCKILTGSPYDVNKVAAINDTSGKKLGYNYPTAKERIIAALKEKLPKIELKVDKEEMQLN